MANYIVTDTELSSIADAIRLKGGTSNPLAFPSGFASAIEAIQGSSAVGEIMPYVGYTNWKASQATSLSFTDITLPDNSIYVCIFGIHIYSGSDFDSFIGCTPVYTKTLSTTDKICVAIVTSQNDISNGIGFTTSGSGTNPYLIGKITRYMNVSNISLYGTPVTTGITNSSNIYSVNANVDGPFIAICVNKYENKTNDFLEVWGCRNNLTFEVPMHGNTFPVWNGSQTFTEFCNFVASSGSMKFIPPNNSSISDNQFAVIILSVVKAGN